MKSLDLLGFALATVWILLGIGALYFIYKKQKQSQDNFWLWNYKTIIASFPATFIGLAFLQLFDYGFSMNFYTVYATTIFAFVLIDTILFRFNLASFTLFHFFRTGLDLKGQTLSIVAVATFLAIVFQNYYFHHFQALNSTQMYLFRFSLLAYSVSLIRLQFIENKKMAIVELI